MIPQLADSDRITIENLQSYYLTTPQGTQVPLSALVKLQHQVEPSKRSQMQQINSITIEGLMIPPNTIGDALAELAEQSEAVFPRGYHYDYTGPSHRY